jgi:2-dehydro-3-deoxygluconokinase
MIGALDPEVITLGETMAVLSAPPGIPLRMAHTLQLTTAGADSNVAIGLARLGVGSAWWGRVGNDEFGRLVLSQLRAERVDVSSVVVDPSAPTGVWFKERRTPTLVRVTYYRRQSAGSRLNSADLPGAVPSSARHLHLTGITPALSDSAREAVDATLRLAHEAALTVSFDVNYRSALWSRDVAAPVLAALARRADLLFATEDEARLLLAADGHRANDEPGAADGEEALCGALAALGPPEVIIKLGASGAVSQVRGEMHRVSAEATAVVDPIGAGDAFVTGYLAAFLAGEGPVSRLRWATRTAAFAIGAEGDWEGLPTRQELVDWEPGADPVHR